MFDRPTSQEFGSFKGIFLNTTMLANSWVQSVQVVKYGIFIIWRPFQIKLHTKIL